jgi:O-antigen biosynthesis protein
MPVLLVIGHVWPEPTSSAAGKRMIQLLEFFQTEGYQITFTTTAKESENKADLESLGIKTGVIKLNDPGFDSFLEELNPEVVLFDRFMMEEQFGWRVDNVCPDAVKILDTEDLHFLRDARLKAFKNKTTAEEIYFSSDLAKREIAAIYRCDLSLIISEVEMDLLITKFRIPQEIILYLPFLLDGISVEAIEGLPAFEDRSDFISIGNFLHEPNWNAVLCLKENLWPEIRKKLPNAKIKIYGAYISQKALNLHNEKENFLIKGWVEDSALQMRNARLCLAPIQFGAGLKGKLVEAMQNGTPSITTKIGAEGIAGDLDWNGFIAENDEQFITHAVELYSEKKMWEVKQKAGFQIINERFNKPDHSNILKKKLQELTSNIEDHRSLNFTGKMLKYHLHRSTYFMSRFIEEKNRK